MTEFFWAGKMFTSFSSIGISLIPKVSNPTIALDYEPTACCTTVYKIITKILINRIKCVVGLIVSPSQIIFIEGRSIVDNVHISHEILK